MAERDRLGNGVPLAVGSIERLDFRIRRLADDRGILLQEFVLLRDAPTHDLVVAIEPEREPFAIQDFLPHVAVDQELQLLARRRGTVLLLVRGREPVLRRRIDDDAVAVGFAAGPPLRQQQQRQSDREKVRERLARNSREHLSCTPLETRTL